ncbi:unnamed protein product [Moneuplotes crassus]|uniref:Uncharacterized protein n=1 Tax=Euplotes crassus TaxID=5936 RepID=A0AAD2D315_EUPCR|nr:unnamed protein product [Moneuplotes crassus]
MNKVRDKPKKVHQKKIRRTKLNRTVEIRGSSKPPPYTKTALMREQRCTEIERENRILFEKMSKIFNRKAEFRKFSSSPKPTRPKIRQVKGIHTTMDSDHIAKENLRLLSRLQGCKPNYNFDKLRSDYKAHSKRVKKISKNKILRKGMMDISMPKIKLNKSRVNKSFKSVEPKRKVMKTSNFPPLNVTVKERPSKTKLLKRRARRILRLNSKKYRSTFTRIKSQSPKIRDKSKFITSSSSMMLQKQ